MLVDQYIDRTRSRASSFFEEHEIVAHVSFADPVDHALLEALYESAVLVGAKVHKGGAYICIEGPQFSTRAESNLYRSWGAEVVGMTNLPEARLAREAEIPYASIAMVTDYDCWHEEEEDVSINSVIEVLHRNVETVRKMLRELLTRLPDPTKSPASCALKHAIITAPECISREKRELLDLLLGRYLPR